MKRKLSIAAVCGFLMLNANVQAQNWLLNGNAGTTSTNFLGTTDAKALKIKTNNSVRMTITSAGKVGIANQAPKSRLDVFGGGTDTNAVILGTVKYSGSVDVSAVKGISTVTDSTGFGVEGNGNLSGVYGYGNNYGVIGNGIVGVFGTSSLSGTTGFPTGLWGQASGGQISNAVYGYATGGNQNFSIWGDADDTVTVGGIRDYAGYFNGNVFGARYFQLSDERFKKNIEPMNAVLPKLMQVKTATYTYDRSKFPNLHLPAGAQMGYLAENLESQFPMAVANTILPQKVNPVTGEVITQSAEAKVVNYNAMIPVLTKAIQEQQVQIEAKDQMIEALQKQMAALESRLNHLEGNSNTEKTTINVSDARLEQNTPNPFNGVTTINYTLPENTTNATITITGINGQVIRTVNLNGKGKGQLLLQAEELSAGSYMYSLHVNGNLIDTKSLLLQK